MAEPTPISSFFFQNDPNINAELRKRIALQMMASQSKFPKTIGEGLSAIGDAIGDRGIAYQLGQQDLAMQGLNPPAAGATGPQAYSNVRIQDEPGVQAITAASGPSISPVAPSAIAQQQPRPASLPPAQNQVVAPGATPEEGGFNELDAAGAVDPTFARQRAIGGIESGGSRNPYATLGAVTRSGDRAYGKYQVMGANVGPWTQAHLGQAMTPQQFLTSQEAQDTVFNKQFGGYADKYGEEGAAKAWYAGEGGMNNPNATDQHGRLTVAGYGQDYLRRLSGGDPRAAITAQMMAFAPTGAGGGPGGQPAQPAPVQVAQAQLQPRNPQRTVTDIQPAPAQQQYPPGYIPPAAARPQGAPIIPPTADEVRLSTWAAQQAARGNPYAAPKVAAQLDALRKEREIRQNEANEWYKAQIAKGNVQDTQRIEAQRGQAKAIQEHQKGAQDLIGGTGGAPSSGVLQGGGAYVPGSFANTPRNFDPRVLGTDASPQRTGIPTPEPIQPGVTPAAHAADQQKKMSSINDAVDKGTQALQQQIELIQLARTHPGRAWGLGGTGSYMRESPWAGDAYAFGAINKQLTGKNFLSGYESLKGAGAIGVKEGEKAEQAQGAVDPNMKKEHYDAALQRLEDTLRGNLEIAQRKANRPVTAWPTPNGEPAPDIGQPGVRNGKSVVYVGGDPSKDASYKEVGR